MITAWRQGTVEEAIAQAAGTTTRVVRKVLRDAGEVRTRSATLPGYPARVARASETTSSDTAAANTIQAKAAMNTIT